MLNDDALRTPQSVQEMENRGFKSAAVLFLKGAVYQFIVDNPNRDFCVRDLLGGQNRNWKCTPLQYLYDFHIRNKKTEKDAYDQAAKDAGWLLKEVLHDDQRYYFDNSHETYFARVYSVKGIVE